MRAKPITIVGGGLAGLALGIGLRQRRVPVTILEAGHYPRHKVCGEFISGRGQLTLARLGLSQPLLERGIALARTAVFFFEGKPSSILHLPSPAYCISRYELDAFLAGRFRELGGELHEHERVRDISAGEAFILANGREAQAVVKGCRWFGLKMHARGIQLAADLEMHTSPDGYIGMSRLGDGRVNICGLFRAPVDSAHHGLGRYALLRGPKGSILDERLREAMLDETSFASVAGLCLQPRRAAGRGECVIGDALTMIAPVTGNGMSMALEGAELAIEPMVQYSQGLISWMQARDRLAERCDAAFGARLRWAAWLQSLMFAPVTRRLLGIPLRCNQVRNFLFARTR